MRITIELEQSDFDSLHDTVLEATNQNLTKKDLTELWNNLPDDIQGQAMHYGTSDSVFRDNLYEHLKG